MPPGMRRFFKRTEATIIFGAVLIFVIFAIVDTEGWFSFFTIRNITRFTAILGLVAIGETLLILVQEIDLSVGSVYGLVAITFLQDQTADPLLPKTKTGGGRKISARDGP